MACRSNGWQGRCAGPAWRNRLVEYSAQCIRLRGLAAVLQAAEVPGRLDLCQQIIVIGWLLKVFGGRRVRGDHDQWRARAAKGGPIAAPRTACGCREAAVVVLVPDDNQRRTLLPGLRAGDGGHRIL